jgi:beta-1,4-N-acetylglucosaminyltransferase
VIDADGGAPARRILFVTSPGGHLIHLIALRPWWEPLARSWVTFDTEDARSSLEGERITFAYSPTTRNVPNLVRNAVLALRLLRTERPDVIVSSGAGVAVPFFWLARCFGIRTVFVEVFDRVGSATLSGRLCYPVADAFLVQWDRQRDFYPDATDIGHLL